MKTIGTTGGIVDCRKGVQHATTHMERQQLARRASGKNILRTLREEWTDITSYPKQKLPGVAVPSLPYL
jgi:hypothetical protein